MAGNDERVNLLISAAVEGLSNVESLIGELQELEKSGGKDIPDNTEGLRSGVTETAKAMEGLATKLQTLQKQQALVTQFAELKKESQQLAKEQEKANASATALGKTYSQLNKPTRAQTREFENARKASRQADQAYVDNQRSLNELRGELEGAGVSTKDLASEQVRIRQELQGVNTQASGLSGELASMRDSAQEAAKGTRDAADGTNRLGEAAEKSRGFLGKMGGVLKSVGFAVAGLTAAAGASIATLTLFSRTQGEAARNITNTSEALDFSTRKLQEWRLAGKEFNLEGDKVSDILKDVTEKIGDFSATGGGEGADVFEQLNLRIRDFRNLAPDEQLLKLSAAITDLNSRSEQIFFLESLSNDASLLLPLLENNAAALRKIASEAEASGAILSDKELADLVKANDIYNDIDLKLKGLVNRISVELAPTVAKTTEKLIDLFGTSEDGEDLIDVFKRLIERAGEFARTLVTDGDQIADRFRTIITVLQTVGNVGRTVFNGLMTAVSAFLTLVSTSASAVTTLLQAVAKGLETIGIISEESYGKVANLAERARKKTKELAEQTAEYAKSAVAAGADIAGAFTEAQKAATKAKKETENAGAELTTLAEDIKTAGEAAEEALNGERRAADRARKSLKDMGVDVGSVMTGISSGASDAIDSLDDLAADILQVGAEGEDAAELFQKGFDKAFKEVSSKEELEELKKKIRGLKEDGEIGRLGANAALEKIRLKMLELNLTDLDLGLDETSKDAETAAEKIERVKQKAKDAAEEAKKAREEFLNAWGGAFAKAISNAREQVTALSTSARNLFEMKIGGNAFVNEAKSAAEQLERARQRTDELTSARQRLMSNSFAAWFADTAIAAAEVEQKFWGQAVALENLTDKVEQGAFSMDQLSRLSDTAANKFDLLDSQQLSGLQSAIDAARSKLESLNSSAESTLNSLQQRLADIQGDTEEAQRLQYEAERRRLQEQLDQAREAGATSAAADYAKALEQLEKINKIEQRNRREEENAREKAAADRQRQQEQAERDRQRAAREQSTTTNRQESIQPRATQTIILQTPSGGQTEVQTSDPDGFLSVLEDAGLRSN